MPCCTRYLTDSRSVAPPAGDNRAVAVAPRAEGDHLEAVVAGFESAGHFWRDPDRVERLHLDDLVVEFEQAGAADDHVDLLRLLVVVAEGLPLARFQAVEAEPRLLRLDVVLGEPRLHVVAEAELRRRVLDLVQLFMGEGIAHAAPFVADLVIPLPAAS
jgi:hypothetical protein